jgi:hypothetical protein
VAALLADQRRVLHDEVALAEANPANLTGFP